MIPGIVASRSGASGGGGPGGPSDPDFASVICLLNANDAGTAAIDQSPVGHTVTATGTPVFVAPGRARAYAMRGTLIVNYNHIDPGATYRQLNPGPVDVTFECWVRMVSGADTSNRGIFGNGSAAGGSYWGFYTNGSRKVCVAHHLTFTEPSAPAAINDDTWHHLAFCVEGSTRRFYKDGVQIFSAASGALVLGSTSTNERWGTPNFIHAAPDIDVEDCRITRGVARYPGGTTFTPPAAAFPTS